jgi:hypothetical protein
MLTWKPATLADHHYCAATDPARCPQRLCCGNRHAGSQPLYGDLANVMNLNGLVFIVVLMTLALTERVLAVEVINQTGAQTGRVRDLGLELTGHIATAHLNTPRRGSFAPPGVPRAATVAAPN